MLHREKDLSIHRLKKSREDLETAKVNFDNGFIKASINRSYYSIFHAIRAVNAINKFDSKRHSGVIAHFNQFFIHTEEFEKEIYKIITSAYRIREKSDYDDFYIASNEDAKVQIVNAEKFLIEVEKFLKDHYEMC